MTLFFFINLFHSGRYGPPSRSNWNRGVQLIASRGESVPVFEGNIATCDFPGGHPEPLSPSGSAHTSLLYNWNLVTNCNKGL